jgi:hypothetical protein
MFAAAWEPAARRRRRVAIADFVFIVHEILKFDIHP